jgi:acyl-coenzyme A thioesterase PaaI-like protein
MTAIDTDIPAGFERHFRRSPLTEPWEPLYSKRTDRAVIIGLRLAKPHTNGRGLIHGGLIAAPTTRWATAARMSWAAPRRW